MTLGTRPGEAVAVNQQTMTNDLGLELIPVSEEIRQQQDLPDGLTGALVSSVTADSPAYKAGLRRGMVLTAVGAKIIETQPLPAARSPR